MAVVAKSRSILHKEKCDFNKAVFNKYLFGRFQLNKPSCHCEIYI